jgi:adenine-specific DNA-methyltransferase
MPMGETIDRRARHRAPHKIEAARRLRGTATEAERALWGMLRGGRLCGVRFRRQQPLGPYIVDFYCFAAKLVIELDGSQHGEDSNIAYDERRTRYLEAAGFGVLRIWNHEFLEDREAVGVRIERILRERIPHLMR